MVCRELSADVVLFSIALGAVMYASLALPTAPHDCWKPSSCAIPLLCRI